MRSNQQTPSTTTSVAKYKKAPGAPLRFKSSYMFFSIEKHKQIRNNEITKRGESKDKICTIKVAKMVSQAWKELSREEREIFEEMARKDKERFEREKSRYTGPWKVLDERLRKKKDPDAPKKPMSAFLAFSNGKRAQVKKNHGGEIDNAKLSRILAQMWKEASKDKRKLYIDEEFKLRQEYKILMEKWRKKNQESERKNESYYAAEGRNNPNMEQPMANSEYYHENGYVRDVPYFDHIKKCVNAEQRRASYGSEYQYSHYQNGRMHQLHTGIYPAAPQPSYGNTTSQQNHPLNSPQPPQQQFFTAADENKTSGPGPYHLHTYTGLALPAPIADINHTHHNHHHHGDHQHQMPYSAYHQETAPTRTDPLQQAIAAPWYGCNPSDANSNNYSSTGGDYCLGKTKYISSDSAYGGNSYQEYSPAPINTYYNNHYQQYQYNGNYTYVEAKNSHPIATQNYGYYDGENSTASCQYQESIAYHSQEQQREAQNLSQQQPDGSHLNRFNDSLPFFLSKEESFWGAEKL